MAASSCAKCGAWHGRHRVRGSDRNRLVAYYAGADLSDPMRPGLTRINDAPYPGAYLRPLHFRFPFGRRLVIAQLWQALVE
jgi:hypothetical protein